MARERLPARRKEGHFAKMVGNGRNAEWFDDRSEMGKAEGARETRTGGPDEAKGLKKGTEELKIADEGEGNAEEKQGVTRQG